MTVYRAAPSPTKSGTIAAILQAVHAPDWASPNLDGLADVLRDLSWLAAEPVELHWHVHPDLDGQGRTTVRAVLDQSVAETTSDARSISLHVHNEGL